MKKLFKLLLCFLFSVAITLTASCGGNKWQTLYFTYFNTNVTITLKNYDLKANKNQIDNLLSSLENDLSVSNPNSPAYAFNNASKGEVITLSKNAIDLIGIAKDFDLVLPNKFSPAIFPLIDLWQFSPEKYGGIFTLPNNDQIDQTKALCDLDLISINTINNTAVKSANGVMLDFGGVAKGYALTKMVDLINSKDVSGYVNLGGSSIYVYSVPDYLSISHPRENGDILRVLPHVVKNAYIGTSGDYQRFYVKEGVRYSHIIDLTTGKPTTSGFVSVTVICNDGALSDMFSTALSCLSYDEMIALLTENTFDIDVFAVYLKDGVKEILTNKKQGDDFTLLDTTYIVKSF